MYVAMYISDASTLGHACVCVCLSVDLNSTIWNVYSSLVML